MNSIYSSIRTLNRVKIGHAFTFMKYLASVVSLTFLLKSLILNKITFRIANAMNLVELTGRISKKLTNIPFSIRFIIGYYKDFRSLYLQNKITSTNTPRVFHVETTWKRLFPCRFNVEYTWSVCRGTFQKSFY